MKKFPAFLLCCFLMLTVLPVTAYADMGPKPSIHITFENMGDAVCYGTLLSRESSTGPASAWNGNPENKQTYDNEDIWQAFVDYEDADGYYFLQEQWLCSESGTLDWVYYPPENFKVLLYYPETDTYTVSDVCERYAFDSYFTVTMNGLEIESVREDYQYGWEIISLILRVILTIVLELAVAWCFGLRRKAQIRIILGVNVVTQIILNVLLNAIHFTSGDAAFIWYYILLECVVFALEAAAYSLLFRRLDGERVPGGKIVLYALTANVFSFVGGMGVARIVPGIF